MSDLDLIHQLGERLGRPLDVISEDRFKQHNRVYYTQNWTDRISRDAYSLGADGTVSGLFLRPVTSTPWRKYRYP